MNSRRRLVLALGAGTLLPRWAAAQTPAKVYRVGFLTASEPPTINAPLVQGLIRGLAKDGYVLDRNLAFELRGVRSDVGTMPQLVNELLATKVDVIVAAGYPSARAAKLGAGKVPVVIFGAGDPVATGLADSLSRPGGNLTGVSDVAAELAPKRLQLLKEVAPGLRRVAMIWNAGDLGMTVRYEASSAAAKVLGIVVQPFGVREPDDFGDAFVAMARDLPDAILMVADRLTNLNRKRIYEFAAARRLPAIYEFEPYVTDGGLMSYGPDSAEGYERLASLVARIFKGAKPAELPFEQPTLFRLVINLKTAKAAGISIPQSLLLRADRVIE